MTGSLAYRRHTQRIWRGDVPDKYARVARFVTGKRVLEIGSAEGVLALTMAQTADRVIGVEMSPERHATAMKLKEEYRRRGRRVDNCELVCADILSRMSLLRDVDTVVAVRSIYYLREHIETMFYMIGQHASEVVLCGNPHRWPRYKDVPERLGQFNWFACRQGMRALLEPLGYTIVHEVKEGDPIVVGRRIGNTAAANYSEDRA